MPAIVRDVVVVDSAPASGLAALVVVFLVVEVVALSPEDMQASPLRMNSAAQLKVLPSKLMPSGISHIGAHAQPQQISGLQMWECCGCDMGQVQLSHAELQPFGPPKP